MADLPAILAQLRARVRAVPGQNPNWGSDALLIVAEAIDAAAVELDSRFAPASCDALAAFAVDVRQVAANARSLAPVFAPPAPDGAALEAAARAVA